MFGIVFCLDGDGVEGRVIVDVVMVDVVVVVVVIATVVVEIVPAQVRMHPARTVMAVVMVIRVRVHQRRAQRANWNSYGERDGE